VKNERLERTMLFVPAIRWPMIEKALASEADAICLDLEDSVPPEEKAAARANAVRAFREFDFGPRARVLRINGLDTPFAYRDVIDTIEAAGDRVDLIMLPKAGSAGDVEFVDKLLTQIEAARGFQRPIGIEAQIETAAAFVYVREIARASPRLEALIFGPGDYAASMRMPSLDIGGLGAADEIYPGHRWHAVMHAIVAAARANDLRAVDGPYAAFKDAEGFERSCRIAHALGFDGKQCIHPLQLAAANRIFSPAPEEADRAAAMIEAYEKAVAEGRGAVTCEGRMIDAANLRMARVVLQKSRRGSPASAVLRKEDEKHG
jgi:citrate lyase subunit beta/citryl-CoA lyase